MNLELRIDELLLDEPWRTERDALSDALSTHLARLAADGGEPTGRDRLHIEHLVVDAPLGTPADQLAGMVAAQIWNHVQRGRR